MVKALVVGSGGTAVTAATIRRPESGEFVWINLTGAAEEDLAALEREFRFHPLTLDDVRSYDQRPKLEEYGDHLFLVMHRLVVTREPADVTSQELHAFVAERYLVTAHDGVCGEIDAIMARVQADPELQSRGPAFWLYLVANAVAEAGSAEIEGLGNALEVLEENVLTGKGLRILEQLLELKRSLATARRLVSPQRDVFAVLAKLGSNAVPERSAVYFRNVYDQLVRTLEALDSHRELASNSLEAHFSILSQRTNEIMKHLTVLSSIFLPLTFVTGFFGQNFEHLPFASDALMWTGILSCVVLPVSMLSWFRFKRWL